MNAVIEKIFYQRDVKKLIRTIKGVSVIKGWL
jgi:hypothetical protein